MLKRTDTLTPDDEMRFDFTSREQLERFQLDRLRALLRQILAGNSFYCGRLQEAGLDAEVDSLEAFRQRMPWTTKGELVADQAAHQPYGTNLSFPIDRYLRMHQTSGTTGRHLRWLDTAESWSAMVAARVHSLRGAGVTAGDRVFVGFSFGPSLGFWLIFEAANRLGCMTIAGGGLDSRTRLAQILANKVDVLCATPTYALRLAEVARDAGLDLARCAVRRIMVGGEPGGSVPAVRRRIEAAWPGARTFDLYGMTETGPITYQSEASAGYVHVLEASYLCEIVEPATGEAVEPGSDALGELVVTTLDRVGSPLLRYRTGDLVRRCPPLESDPDHVTMKLRGGVLGRRDDMVVVRGVNLYPSAVDQVVFSRSEIAEYRVEIGTVRGMTEVELHIEPRADVADPAALARSLEEDLHRAFNLRMPVSVAGPQELPRFDVKVKRWQVRGNQ